MRTSFRVIAGTILTMACLAGVAIATPSFTGWYADASVRASATAGPLGPTDSCTDPRSYTGAGLITDALYCEAQAGYGYGTCAAQLETTVDTHSVSTDVSGDGYGQGYLTAVGSGAGDFDQRISIDIDSRAAIVLVGTLSSNDASSATVRIQNAGGTVVEYVADTEFQPVSIDEAVVLGAGQYEMIVNLALRPQSAGPGGQTNTAASATLTASFAVPVGVDEPESRTWGRVKDLYR